jgi:hypothetical protein
MVQTQRKTKFGWINSRGQFDQRFACSFLVQKFFCAAFFNYILGLYFFGARLLAQKNALKILVKLTRALSREPFSVSAAL